MIIWISHPESLATPIPIQGPEIVSSQLLLVAAHYPKQISLHLGKRLPNACRIFGGCLHASLGPTSRLSTHVFVMSILIMAIRILYDMNGFGRGKGLSPFQLDPLPLTDDSHSN